MAPTQLESIKKQLAELTSQVEQISGEVIEYTFTQEQMVGFVEQLHGYFLQRVKNDIEYVDAIDDDSFYEISLDGNEICVELDTSAISSYFLDTIGDMDEDEIIVTVDNLYNDIKS